ncbi:MAG: hypothetical protein IJ838_00150 [Paludibacteraceae bacterium]|nr:hypothetical protein [Paludibacteraceae bacterium]
MDSVFTQDSDSGLSDRLRANVSRFAAYKAEYISAALNRALNDENTPAADRPKLARAVLHTFNRYQDAERSTTAARARTAKQFEEFQLPDNKRLFPNLKWLPSRSADPRVSHTAFYNHIWSKDDPFWNTNAPGTEWNCKCDIEETDEPLTDNTAVPQPAVPLGLEGNPAKTGEIFTDNASYIRAYSRSRRTREDAEEKCEKLSMKQARQMAGRLKSERTSLSVEGEQREVIYTPDGISHCVNDMLGRSDVYWLKNEVLPQVNRYIAHAEYMGKKVSDTGHNSRSRTVNLKQNTDYYYYYKITLPSGQECYIHLGHYKTDFVNTKRAGKMYLYSITKNLPTDIETP